MSLFDIFTGASQKEAAANSRTNLLNNQTTNAGLINTGLTDSSNYITDAGTKARSIYDTSYQSGVDATNGAYGDATNLANSGLTAANGYYDQGKAAYTPLSDLASKYGGATTMALNSLGVNGQAGTDAARSAFTAGPAYNWNLDQGINSINRRRAAGGMLDSGNADRDAQTYGAGLASNEYNTWMNNLLGFTNPALSATGQAASGLGSLNASQAGLNNSNMLTQAQYANSRGGMLADLAKTYGSNVGGSYTNQGNTLAGLNTNATNSLVSNNNNATSGINTTYKNEADAETAGSGNLWGLGLNLAKLGTGLAGGSGSGSGYVVTGYDSAGNPNYGKA